MMAKPLIDLRRRLYRILEHGHVGSHATRLVSAFLVCLVLINLFAAALETVPFYEARYGGLFHAIELVSLIVFTLEYLTRLWVATEHEPDGSAMSGRLNYALSAEGVIDFVTVLPFWLVLFMSADLRVLLVLRVFRFFKLARYSVGVRSLFDALYAEWKPLLGCIVIFLGTALIAASLMYLAERDIQPDKFGTIPEAMWWAVTTLGTTGYGDAVPVSLLGRVVNTFTVMAALVMIALPVGIVASAFANQIHRRDFVATWGMVARVPLFEGLNAGEIADIARLLRTQSVDKGAIIVRRGEPAHQMYFIASGEVEIALPRGHKRLGPGEFFGENAVLNRRAKRSATVSALEDTRLLILGASDVHDLAGREPRIGKRLRSTAKIRAE